MPLKLIILAGPTAVGKTEYSIEIARKFNCEIVSADSMQLYKYMDIGSAKPSKEELSAVKHYLVDEIDPRDPFSAAYYQNMAFEAIRIIADKGNIPLISGGTGLYVNSIIYNMDFSAPPIENNYRENLLAEAKNHEIIDEDGNSDNGAEFLHSLLKSKSETLADRIHKNNIKKVIRALEVLESSGEEIPDFSNNLTRNAEFDPILIGLNRNREELYKRINTRVDLLMEQGLVNEVKTLMSMGLSSDDISMKGIGYKEIIGALNSEYSMDEAVELVKKNTRHYAKRQLSWFRRYKDMKWFDISSYDSKDFCLEEIFRYIASNL